MFLCDKVVPSIRVQVLNNNLVLADPAHQSYVYYAFGASMEGLIGERAEFIFHWVQNEIIGTM